MADDWSMDESHISSDEVDSSPEEDPVDHLDTYEINTDVVSDTLRQLRRKAEMSVKSNRYDDTVSGGLDDGVKRFLLENAGYIDYRDLARLTGVKSQDMKAFLNRMGVNVPVTGAKRWDELTFRDPDSPEECANCPVQARHSTFYAGIYNCRQCFEENITYWIEERESIHIKVRDRM